jgi:hypothetical protein
MTTHNTQRRSPRTRKQEGRRPTSTGPRRHIPDLTTRAALETRQADLELIGAAVVLVHEDSARAEALARVLLDRVAGRVDEFIARLDGFMRALVGLRCGEGWNRPQIAAALQGRALASDDPNPGAVQALAEVLRVLAALHALPPRPSVPLALGEADVEPHPEGSWSC